MQEQAIRLLKELTEAHSVPGHEAEVREIFVRELQSCGALSADRNGSIFCQVGKSGPRVMIAGHMDEVGFLVQNITPDGFIQFVAVGGWWEHQLLAQRVEIKGRGGKKIMGVVSSRPPHFLPEAQRKQVMSIDGLFIDVGADSRQQVEEEFGISIGDPIAPVSKFEEMGRKGYFMAKAFDNRVGMAGTIQAGQVLATMDLPNQLILAGTVQEEVGLRGARSAAVHAQPDVVIVLEGPPADDTPGFARSESQGRLGGGVQIRAFDPSAIMNPRLVELVVSTAKQAGIRHQVTVRRSGGTDAGAFHMANQGIPCVVLGVPSRYIHSHNGMIAIEDYQEMVKLAVAVAKRMDTATVEGLTKYF